MLKDRILATLKFFDLQDIPLTLLELHRFLIVPPNQLGPYLNQNWELPQVLPKDFPGHFASVTTDELLSCLDSECQGAVEQKNGYYSLTGRTEIIDRRLNNYFYGIKRERLIRRFLGFLKHLPFVRGVGIGGSQSLGQQKPTSDIDLFIITEKGFLWIARTLVTLYLQLLGHRRHGSKIANRFCLNHYLAGVREVSQGKNFYHAIEHLRIRPVIYPSVVEEFLSMNRAWVNKFFPNASLKPQQAEQPSFIQRLLERCLTNKFGLLLEQLLGNWQLKRIRRGDYLVAEPYEIFFHSKQRKAELLTTFFSQA